jgi:hypothetical protein
MRQCLTKRLLVQVATGEGSLAEHAHLRLCADCSERYDALVEDLGLIGRIFEAPPPAGLRWRAGIRSLGVMLPAAAVLLAVLALAVGVGQWRTLAPLPMPTGSRESLSALAADVSTALFAPADAATLPQLAAETGELQAALDAGRPCTQEEFLSGECDDQLQALVFESE